MIDYISILAVAMFFGWIIVLVALSVFWLFIKACEGMLNINDDYSQLIWDIMSILALQK